MTDRKLLRTGMIGSAIAALCCFTPLLVFLFGVVGVSAWLGWIDYVLFPALAFFLAMTGYAAYRLKQQARAARGTETEGSGAEP